jgi:hypothetical protein
MPNAPAVFQRGSGTLAASIEGDTTVKETPAQIIDDEVQALLYNRLASGDGTPIDTVVLGCTHYPLVKADIVAAFDRIRTQTMPDGTTPCAKLIAPTLTVVDPAAWTAQDLWRTLETANLRMPVGAKPAAASDLFFISVANPAWPSVQLSTDGTLTKDFKYGRDAGNPGREDTVIVPMTIEGLPTSAANLVKTRLPKTAESMRSAAAQ